MASHRLIWAKWSDEIKVVLLGKIMGLLSGTKKVVTINVPCGFLSITFDKFQ